MGVELCGAVLSLHAAHIRETVQTHPCTWGSPVLYVLSPGAGEAMSVLRDNLSATESQEPGPSPGAIGRCVGRPRAAIGCRPGLLTLGQVSLTPERTEMAPRPENRGQRFLRNLCLAL